MLFCIVIPEIGVLLNEIVRYAVQIGIIHMKMSLSYQLRPAEVGPTAAGGATRKHGASRRRKWNRDRVRAQQEELPEGGSSQRGSEQTGEHPGVVCFLSAMEPCGSYKPWA